MPILEKGCFCCKLQTCVRTQGYLTAIFSGITILLGVYAVVQISNIDIHNNPNVNKEDVEAAVSVLRILVIVLIVSSVITFILAVLLLVGSYLKRKSYILPYLILSAINIVLSVCLMFGMLTTAPTQAVVSQVLGLALSVYCWIHVLSYYQELKEEEEQGKNRYPVGPMMHKV